MPVSPDTPRVRVLFIAGAMIFIALFVIFTFTDLKVITAVYRPFSPFGRAFEIAGPLPMPMAAFFSSIGLLATMSRGKLRMLQSVGVSAAFAYFAVYGFRTFLEAVPRGGIPFACCLAAWALISIRAVCGIKDKRALRRACLIAFVGSVVAAVGIMGIKLLLSRPRFLSLSDPKADFSFWFVHHPLELLSLDSSFPSGHAAQASLLFCLLLLPHFIKMPRHEKLYKSCVFFSSLAFIVCVMISRILVGRHYPTDVLAGAVIPPIFMLLAARLLPAPPVLSSSKNK